VRIAYLQSMLVRAQYLRISTKTLRVGITVRTIVSSRSWNAHRPTSSTCSRAL